MFLDQLLIALRLHTPSVEIRHTAAQHGNDLFRKGFDVSQVVRSYGDICQSITDLALEWEALITVDDFRTLNRCLDDAIASAVAEFGRERDLHREDHAATNEARVIPLMEELRSSVHVARVALEVVGTGTVGVSGSTGKLLSTHVARAEKLLGQLFDEFAAAGRVTGRVMVEK